MMVFIDVGISQDRDQIGRIGTRRRQQKEDDFEKKKYFHPFPSFSSRMFHFSFPTEMHFFQGVVALKRNRRLIRSQTKLTLSRF